MNFVRGLILVALLWLGFAWRFLWGEIRKWGCAHNFTFIRNFYEEEGGQGSWWACTRCPKWQQRETYYGPKEIWEAEADDH